MHKRIPRSVLVTGGAHRLGALICQQFAQDGWHVWCHAQNSMTAAAALCQQIVAQGGQAQAVQADLSSDAERPRMMALIAVPLSLPPTSSVMGAWSGTMQLVASGQTEQHRVRAKWASS